MKQTQKNRAHEKIKKLNKVHILPSIFFFLFTFMITGISVAIFVSLFMINIFQEKFDSALQNTNYIGKIIENRVANGESYDQAFQFIEDNIYVADAAAVLDSDDNILGHFGKASYDLKRYGSLELWDTYYFYMDQKSSGEIFNTDGDMKLNWSALFKKCIHSPGSEGANWINDTIYKEPYWIVLPDKGDGIRILVRNELQFYRRDVLFIGAIGIGIMMIMCLPLLFLFIHVLSNIRAQRRMYGLINTDFTTGGHNWLYFCNHADKKLRRRRNASKCFAVIHLSYVRYRNFCACHSLEDGEMLLQEMDKYLNSHLRKQELCAHVSEGNFAVLVMTSTEEILAKRVEEWFQGMRALFPRFHAVFAAGVCMIEPQKRQDNNKYVKRKDIDVSKLFHNASMARDAALEKDDNSVLFFNTEMLQEQIWENHVIENMEEALENEEFQVYLQPKYDPVSNKLAGAEALVRWINKCDGFIPPGRFIPIFEKNGFITKLDDYMVSHVAALQARWLEEGRNVVPVSVNISRAHFTQPDLAEHICQLVDIYKLPHELLEIELTESAFFDDKETLLHTVNLLKEYQFDISMDDFGAGYSSLNSLKELPLDVLKLDAEFFRGEFEKERGEIVVSEAIQLAKNLNMKIVAEGIEEKEQVDFLARLGCDMIQGFYFAKPMPSDEYENAM